MRFLTIIENCSLFIAFFCVIVIGKSQDLEEILPVRPSVPTFTEPINTEPDKPAEKKVNEDSTGEATAVVEDLDMATLHVPINPKGEDADIHYKEEEIGMILRQAYYQKMTVPRWAKILATKSWRESFLKWRYFAQMTDFIRSSTYDLRQLKIPPHIAYMSPAAQGAETNNAGIDSSMESSKDTESNSTMIDTMAYNPMTDTPLAAIVVEQDEDEPYGIDTSQEEDYASKGRSPITSQQEEFESGSRSPARDKFQFSLADLTLPDSVASERHADLREPHGNDPKPYNQGLDSSDLTSATATVVEGNGLQDNTVSTDQNDSKKSEVKKTSPSSSDAVIAAQTSDTKKEPPATGKKISKDIKEEIPKTSSPRKSTTAAALNVLDRKSMNQEFQARKGQLPWPVAGARITDRYGYRKNAAQRGLKPENYGIDMEGPSKSVVTAVFPGIVLMTVRQAPYDYIVTVKHGDYTTAYYFLDEVNVKVGDKIEAAIPLGTLRSTPGPVPFHFEVWYDQERMNPEKWLKSK